MSVLIRVEDRTEYGQGHRSRAIAILQAIKSDGKEGYIITSNPDWIEFLKLQKLPVFSLMNLENSTTEIDEILEISKKKKTSKIILDGERFDENYCKKITQFDLTVILLNDLPLKIISSASCIVNPNIYATKDLYPVPWPQKFYGGPDFILLRESFLKPKIDYVINGTVLITLGVSANADLIKLLEEQLENIGFRVVVANNLNEEQMVNAIDNAQIVICGASVTLHEVWSRSRFAIPIYQVKDQEFFKDYLLSQNVKVVEGIGKLPNFICNAIMEIIENGGSELNFFNIDPFGAQRLISHIYEN